MFRRKRFWREDAGAVGVARMGASHCTALEKASAARVGLERERYGFQAMLVERYGFMLRRVCLALNELSRIPGRLPCACMTCAHSAASRLGARVIAFVRRLRHHDRETMVVFMTVKSRS